MYNDLQCDIEVKSHVCVCKSCRQRGGGNVDRGKNVGCNNNIHVYSVILKLSYVCVCVRVVEREGGGGGNVDREKRNR